MKSLQLSSQWGLATKLTRRWWTRWWHSQMRNLPGSQLCQDLQNQSPRLKCTGRSHLALMTESTTALATSWTLSHFCSVCSRWECTIRRTCVQPSTRFSRGTWFWCARSSWHTCWSLLGATAFGASTTTNTWLSCLEPVSSAAVQSTLQRASMINLHWEKKKTICTSAASSSSRKWRKVSDLANLRQCWMTSLQCHRGIKWHKDCWRCSTLRSLANTQSSNTWSLAAFCRSSHEQQPWTALN